VKVDQRGAHWPAIGTVGVSVTQPDLILAVACVGAMGVKGLWKLVQPVGRPVMYVHSTRW
jgi:hypothetical protein